MNEATKKAIGNNDELLRSYKNLNAQERINWLTKQHGEIESKKLSETDKKRIKDNRDLAFSIQGLSEVEREAVLKKIANIEKLKLTLTDLQNKQNTGNLPEEDLEKLTKTEEELESTQKSLDSIMSKKRGLAHGKVYAMAITASIVSAINTFSASRQAMTVGEAAGKSIAGGIGTGISTGMMAFMSGAGLTTSLAFGGVRVL